MSIYSDIRERAEQRLNASIENSKRLRELLAEGKIQNLFGGLGEHKNLSLYLSYLQIEMEKGLIQGGEPIVLSGADFPFGQILDKDEYYFLPIPFFISIWEKRDSLDILSLKDILERSLNVPLSFIIGGEGSIPLRPDVF